MNVDKIKESIAKLSPMEQDNVRQYIDLLQSNETGFDPLPDPIWDEIERRDAALSTGEMKTTPAREVLNAKLDQIRK